MYWYERIARMLTSPKHWTKVECSQRQHIELLFRWIRWTELPSKNQILLVFRFIVENPHLLKRSYPNHSICPVREKKIFYKNMWLMLKKNLTVDLTILHQIFTNHGRLKGVFMHFHILLGLKQQFSARTTEEKTHFTLLILITIFHYPSCFLQACVLLLQNVMKQKKEKRMDFWEIFQFLKCNVNWELFLGLCG